MSVCFSRRAIETRIYPNSPVHLTFSLTHTNTGKFKYGKYKHKKSASLLKCQNCEKSTVKLRYRKLCLSCAQESGRCPQCSKSQREQELEDRAKRDVANDGEEKEEEEEEEEETTDDEAYEEEGIVITRR